MREHGQLLPANRSNAGDPPAVFWKRQCLPRPARGGGRCCSSKALDRACWDGSGSSLLFFWTRSERNAILGTAMRIVRPVRFERDSDGGLAMYFVDAREDGSSFGPEHGPTSRLVSIEVARDQGGLVCNPLDMDEAATFVTTENGTCYGPVLARLQINLVHRLVKLCDSPKWRLAFRLRPRLKTRLAGDPEPVPLVPEVADGNRAETARNSRKRDRSRASFPCLSCGRILTARVRSRPRLKKCPNCGEMVVGPSKKPAGTTEMKAEAFPDKKLMNAPPPVRTPQPAEVPETAPPAAFDDVELVPSSQNARTFLIAAALVAPLVIAFVAFISVSLLPKKDAKKP